MSQRPLGARAAPLTAFRVTREHAQASADVPCNARTFTSYDEKDRREKASRSSPPFRLSILALATSFHPSSPLSAHLSLCRARKAYDPEARSTMEASNGAPGRAAAPALGRSVTRSAAAQAGTTTPTQPAAGLDPMDPLALSAATAPDPLPAPPPPGGSGVAAAGPKKLAPEPPQPVVPPAVGRAKRNRPNVKYRSVFSPRSAGSVVVTVECCSADPRCPCSPARTGKVAPRRIGATAASSSTRPPSAQAETFPVRPVMLAVLLSC